ncbi:unnamed protein product [Brassica oleracea var. botrytis]
MRLSVTGVSFLGLSGVGVSQSYRLFALSETGPEQTYAGGVGALFNPARVNDCVVCSKSSSMASCGQLVRPLHLGYLRHGSRASYLLALIMTLLGFVARLHRCFLSNGIREDFSH